MNEQPNKYCSSCGGVLRAELFATTVDSKYNTVPHYMYGHTCPKALSDYGESVDKVQRDMSLNSDQKANKIAQLGYQNAWRSAK